MDQRHSLPPYVLVTPARNEEAFIEKTIESVIHQTVITDEMGDRRRWIAGQDGRNRKPLSCAVSLDRNGADAATARPKLCSQGGGFQRRL